MAEVRSSYSTKTSLHIGIINIICGVISIGIGAFTTRKDDHTVFTDFKPKGLPVWAGILFVITGGLGVLSFKNPRKCMIIIFMVFSAFCVGGSVIVFWCLLPLMIGKDDISWNLGYGSFLTLTAIAFVVSMKAIIISFRFTITYGCGCAKRSSPRQRPPAVVELGTTLDLSIQHEPSSQRRTSRPIPSHRGASGSCRSQRQHNPYRSSDRRRRRSRDRYQDRERPPLHITQTDQSRERQHVRNEQSRTPIVHIQRPPPPPPPAAPPPPPPPPAYQTIKFPYLPSYAEVEALPPPPPYTEK